jgi:hypothetical protein
MSLAPVNAPDLLATFFSVAACMDRQTAIPVEVVEIVDDPKPRRRGVGIRRARWSAPEDARLLSLWENGASAKAMAKFLGRSRRGIELRLALIKWDRVG